MEINLVRDVPNTFDLAQTADDVAEFLEYLGTDTYTDGYSYVFTRVEDGEILEAYGCYTLDLDAKAYSLM